MQVLRDNEWSNQRRATEKKVATLKANETKPEEERVQCKPLSQLDEIVLDILGKGNVRILTALFFKTHESMQYLLTNIGLEVCLLLLL